MVRHEDRVETGLLAGAGDRQGGIEVVAVLTWEKWAKLQS
jgi:hypothetical protein